MQKQTEVSGICLSDDIFGGQEKVLACPACDFEYSHIRSVYTALADDEGLVPYAGTEARGVAVGYRRQCLVITVDGECEHAWEIRIQQHKGINYVSSRIVAKAEA